MVDALIRELNEKLTAASDDARLRLRERDLPDCFQVLDPSWHSMVSVPTKMPHLSQQSGSSLAVSTLSFESSSRCLQTCAASGGQIARSLTLLAAGLPATHAGYVATRFAGLGCVHQW